MNVSELLESVRRVEVRTNRLVNDTMVGAYQSHFKGRGMDFEELREYIPGDEVRDIDWNVTYRMGRPFVKRYREERELALVLAVDISASSAFGSARRSKREFATEIAATLAISAARSSDKVALLLFSDQVELFLPHARAAATSSALSGKHSASSPNTAPQISRPLWPFSIMSCTGARLSFC